MEILSVGQSASPQGLAKAAQLAPVLAWKTCKLFIRVAVGTAALAVMGMGALAVTEDLGSVQALSAFVEPAQRIASAAEDIRWIQAPASPMVEAGRTAEGGLDVRQMLLAWQDAGMSSVDATHAISQAAKLRPVLMGRQDTLALLEHTNEMNRASAALTGAFPDVISNLTQGKSAPLQDEWEQENWPEVIDRIELSLSHDVVVQTAHQPRSLSQNVADRLAWNAAHPDQATPLPVLLKMSNATEGDASAKVLDLLERAGVPLDTTENIHERLLDATVPLQGLPKAMAHKLIELDADLDLEIAQDLGQEGLNNLARAAASPQFKVASTSQDFSDADWQELRTMIKEEAASAPVRSPPSDISMAQATLALEDAVRDTGLRSISPSLWQLRSTQSVLELANNLQTANAELSRATGWKGKVLGLDGRLELSMGPIMQKDETTAGAAAVVVADTSGRLQMVSGFTELGHEWGHFFDHVSAREVLVNPSQRPLTENVQVFRSVLDPGIKQAMRNLNESLNDGSPKWQEAREKADDRNESHYYMRGAETFAYAFAAYLTNTGAKLLANPDTTRGALLDPQTMPSVEEQAHQHQFFQAVFRSTECLNLSGSPRAQCAPQMKPIQQWRESNTPVEGLRSVERRPAIR